MAGRAVVDAGFLVALLSRRDANHRWAVDQAQRFPPPWSTCEAVLSEAFHLLEAADLSYRETATGVKRAAITGAEMKEMAAEVIRLGPGARLTDAVPTGAERYLFTLTGVAMGDGVSFLEFHVPAGVTTVRG